MPEDVPPGEGVVEIGDRVPLLELDGDEGGRPAGGLPGVGGHDGDRLAPVVDLAVGEDGLVGHDLALVPDTGHLVDGEHGVDAGDRQRRRHVDGPDHRTRQEHTPGGGPQHPLRPEVPDVLEPAGHLRHPVGTDDRLADAPADALPVGGGGHRSPSTRDVTARSTAP